MGFLICKDLLIKEITKSCKTKKRIQHGSKIYFGSEEKEQMYRYYIT
jgi:hypothetical protein